jgi:CheY-like chemotaxis protein
MYTYAGLTPDLHLVAIGVVIWVVAMSVALSACIPVLRRERRVPRAATPAPGPAAAIAPKPKAEPAPAAPREHPEAFSVLIVDDNPVNRQVLELILDSVGVAHASVKNGLEAVEAMQACAYDAVLMDLQMPVMDGFEATRLIRALEAACAADPTRIIVVSANCADEDIADGRKAGADCHLAKPVSAAAVIGELAACPGLERLAA